MSARYKVTIVEGALDYYIGVPSQGNEPINFGYAKIAGKSYLGLLDHNQVHTYFGFFKAINAYVPGRNLGFNQANTTGNSYGVHFNYFTSVGIMKTCGTALGTQDDSNSLSNMHATDETNYDSPVTFTPLADDGLVEGDGPGGSNIEFQYNTSNDLASHKCVVGYGVLGGTINTDNNVQELIAELRGSNRKTGTQTGYANWAKGLVNIYDALYGDLNATQSGSDGDGHMPIMASPFKQMGMNGFDQSNTPQTYDCFAVAYDKVKILSNNTTSNDIDNVIYVVTAPANHTFSGFTAGEENTTNSDVTTYILFANSSYTIQDPEVVVKMKVTLNDYNYGSEVIHHMDWIGYWGPNTGASTLRLYESDFVKENLSPFQDAFNTDSYGHMVLPIIRKDGPIDLRNKSVKANPVIMFFNSDGSLKKIKQFGPGGDFNSDTATNTKLDTCQGINTFHKNRSYGRPSLKAFCTGTELINMMNSTFTESNLTGVDHQSLTDEQGKLTNSDLQVRTDSNQHLLIPNNANVLPTDRKVPMVGYWLSGAKNGLVSGQYANSGNTAVSIEQQSNQNNVKLGIFGTANSTETIGGWGCFSIPGGLEPNQDFFTSIAKIDGNLVASTWQKLNFIHDVALDSQDAYKINTSDDDIGYLHCMSNQYPGQNILDYSNQGPPGGKPVLLASNPEGNGAKEQMTVIYRKHIVPGYKIWPCTSNGEIHIDGTIYTFSGDGSALEWTSSSENPDQGGGGSPGVDNPGLPENPSQGEEDQASSEVFIKF